MLAHMRSFIVFLLSLFLSLNAAYAGVTGVCDALEHAPQGQSEHGSHLGHHVHDHADDAVADVVVASASDPSISSTAKASSDHCHVHGTFSPLLSADLTLHLPLGSHVLATVPAAAPVSIIPARLERPPSVPLA